MSALKLCRYCMANFSVSSVCDSCQKSIDENRSKPATCYRCKKDVSNETHVVGGSYEFPHYTCLVCRSIECNPVGISYDVSSE